MTTEPVSAATIAAQGAELRAVERRAGLRAGKQYDTEGRDYQQAVNDVRFLLSLLQARRRETPHE